MDFELMLVEEGKIGLLISHASITKETFAEMNKDINKYRKDHNVDLLLYDLRNKPLEISAFEQYDVVYNLSNKVGERHCRKIAFLVKKGDHSYDFVETLYLNSGKLAKRFEDYDEAVKWLGMKP